MAQLGAGGGWASFITDQAQSVDTAGFESYKHQIKPFLDQLEGMNRYACKLLPSIKEEYRFIKDLFLNHGHN